jgi:hypothetical protein
MSRTPTELFAALPLIIYIHLIGLLVLAFLDERSRLRTAALILSGILFLRCLYHIRTASEWGELVRIYMCGYMLYANEFFRLKRLRVSATLSTHDRLSAAVALLFSPRMFVPRNLIPSFRSDSRNYVPPRTWFLAHRLLQCSCSLLINDLFNRYRLNTTPLDYVEERQHLIRRLSSLDIREIIIRAHRTLHGHLGPYLLMTAAHSAASAFAVLILRQSPEEWPPLFGSLKDAYTVRRFYSHFWHRVMRTAYVSNAKALLETISFCLPSLKVNRYTVSFTALGISGVAHSIAYSTSWTCATLQPLLYYLRIALAIGVEDLAQSIYKGIMRRYEFQLATCNTLLAAETPEGMFSRQVGIQEPLKKAQRRDTLTSDRTTSKWRYLGYAWTCLFHFWALPNCVFPQIMCQVGRDMLENGFRLE